MTTTTKSLPKVKTIPQNNENNIEKLHNFYKIRLERDGTFKGIYIPKAFIIDKLKEFDFFRFDIDNEKSIYVQIKNNLVKEVNINHIPDVFFKWLEKLPARKYEGVSTKEGEESEYIIDITAEMIRVKICDNLSEYFSKALLNRLTVDETLEIKKDLKTERNFYYKNGFVTVTANGAEFHKYDELKGFIWENQRLNRNFDFDETKGNFEKFFERVCCNDQERIKSLMTITGYLLHSYYACKLFVIILTDMTIGDEDEANGRTGKTLYTKALGQMLNYNQLSRVYTEINGKDFNTNDKHRYSDASIETQLININDLPKRIDISEFFNDITEGFTIDKKNEKPFRIHSKLVFTTNRTLKVADQSSKDRVRQFEFSDYYNCERSPFSEFNQWFFSDDWDDSEWHKFDTFMLKCFSLYLKHGVIISEPVNLKRRETIDHTSREFVSWLDELIKTGEIDFCDENRQMQKFFFLPNERLSKKDLYNAFVYAYPDFKNLKQRTFTSYLRTYVRNSEMYEPISLSTETEGRSNSIDWIVFKPLN